MLSRRPKGSPIIGMSKAINLTLAQRFADRELAAAIVSAEDTLLDEALATECGSMFVSVESTIEAVRSNSSSYPKFAVNSGFWPVSGEPCWREYLVPIAGK